MKCGIRLRLLASTVVLITVLILLIVLEDKCETYDPVAFVQASLPWLQQDDSSQSAPLGTTAGDKIVVVPATEDHDMSWVVDELPDWQHAVYIVNPSTTEQRLSSLTTPVNKGHEAMAYLTYIIDNYDISIPSVVAFLHAHRSGFFEAWHVDTPLHDNVVAMRNLQLDYVREMGYVNLRCNWNPGCKNVGRTNSHISAEVWQDVFYDTSTPVFDPSANSSAAREGAHTVEDGQQGLYFGLGIWTPCCAQFAVTKEQIYARPLDDYVKFRQWLMNTEKNDAQSGRVMEYLWHIIFGRPAVHCPDPEACYCQVYGRC